jgi:xanthine dehydrogenase YagS FAD-binding subunit
MTMKNFEYAQPRTENEVLDLLSPVPGQTELLAGGTDMIGLMKRMVVTPERVVNVSDVESMRSIEYDAQGRLWVGAALPLDEFLESQLTAAFPAVKQCIQGITSVQLRAQGTLGGELLRRPLCWYYRDGHGLLADYGRMAVQGDNRFHAILGNRGPAKFVNASRLAPPFIAVGAQVRIVGPRPVDERIVALEQLYQTPNDDRQRENTLLPNQFVTHVLLPPDDGRLSAAYEVRHGEGPDTPLATAAATLQVLGGLVKRARIVMGQVAPIPWISAEAERALLGQAPTDAIAQQAGKAAVAGALPLSDNAYKVQLAQVAVRRAILRATGTDMGGF